MLTASASFAQTTLKKLWETDSTLRTPESVLFHKPSKRLFVSNIDGKGSAKDGNGFISILNLDGSVHTLRFMDGLDAPKGLAIVGNKLFVTDITRLVVFDINSGQQLEAFDVPSSDFLNDATAGENGNIYFSDSKNGTIFKLTGQKVDVLLKDTLLKNPNGLYFQKGKLMAVDFKTGVFYSINLKTKKLIRIADGFLSGDGIEPLGNESWLISSWPGELRLLHKNKDAKLLLDTKAEKVNCADIGFDPDKKVIYVPTFYHNRVAAYQLK